MEENEEHKEEEDETKYFVCLFRERMKDEKSAVILKKLAKFAILYIS